MNRISKFAAAFAVVPVLAMASPVFADSPGQLATGVNVYKVKNVTTSGAYAATATASACDVVQYSTELNNGGFGNLTSVVVKATLPATSATSSASTVTATPAEGASFGTTGTVTVNLSSAQAINYVNGSAKLYDSNGNVISNLADTILTSGVNIGTINGSTTEYVNFQAKVNCPAPTPNPTPTPTPTPAKPAAKALPNTGPGDVAEMFAGVSTLGAAAHAVTRRFRR